MADQWNPYDQHTCRDCAVPEGFFHEYGCCVEECPFCGGQLISCDCKYIKLRLKDRHKHTKETNYLPPHIFTHGLDQQQHEEWERLLANKGYIPFIIYPLRCPRCGCINPEYFHDDSWELFIQPSMRDTVICKPCYDHITDMLCTASETICAAATEDRAD